MHLIYYLIKLNPNSDQVDKLICGFVTDNSLGLRQSIILHEFNGKIEGVNINEIDCKHVKQYPQFIIVPTLVEPLPEMISQVVKSTDQVEIILNSAKANIIMIDASGSWFLVTMREKVKESTSDNVIIVVKGKVIFKPADNNINNNTTTITKIYKQFSASFNDQQFYHDHSNIEGGVLRINLTEGTLVMIAVPERPDLYMLGYGQNSVIMSVKRDHHVRTCFDRQLTCEANKYTDDSKTINKLSFNSPSVKIECKNNNGKLNIRTKKINTKWKLSLFICVLF